MKRFGDYFVGTLTRPRRTFGKLMDDPQRLRLGIFAVLINAFLYTLVYVFLTLGGGAPSTFRPFLAIPPESYYAYNRFFLAPSMLGAWILSAGTAQLLSRPFGGKGSFEDTLSSLGFAITVSTFMSLLHDLPDTFLGAVGILDLRAYEVALNTPTIWRTILWTLYGLSGVLFLVLFPKAVGAAQRFKRGPAIPIGILSFVVYQGTFLIFNR